LLVFGDQVDSWRKWTELQVPEEVYNNVWDELPFSKAEREKIEALPEIGTQKLLSHQLKTNDVDLWFFNSMLTQFATHEVKSEVRRIDLEPAIARVMENTYSRITVH
jgi:hypothetical protein